MADDPRVGSGHAGGIADLTLAQRSRALPQPAVPPRPRGHGRRLLDGLTYEAVHRLLLLPGPRRPTSGFTFLSRIRRRAVVLSGAAFLSVLLSTMAPIAAVVPLAACLSIAIAEKRAGWVRLSPFATRLTHAVLILVGIGIVLDGVMLWLSRQ
ncbi:hypothetical protein FJZ36_10195 [Candidatus Poribacteria bacterium]|nr:hypothetical protein [Candidatus Poribacteria bacterium]